MSALEDQVRKKKFTVVIVALVLLFVLLGTAPTQTEIWDVVMNPTSTAATAVAQVPTATQTEPAAVTPTPPAATSTPTPLPPTATSTSIPTPLPPSATPEPTPTQTPTPAATRTPTAPAPTPTPLPPTATPEPTPSPTAVQAPTQTPTAAATRTPAAPAPTPDTSIVLPVPKGAMPVTDELAVPAITTPQGDLETRETGVAIGGTAPASAGVVVYDNQFPVGMVIADAEGQWQYKPPEPWSEAEHVIVARTTDGKRISEPSDPVRVVVLGERLPITGKTPMADHASGWNLFLRQLAVLALIAVAALLGLRRSD